MDTSIRVATEADLPVIKAKVKGLIEASDYGKFFKDYELTDYMFHQYIDNPREKLCIVIGDNIGFAMFDTMIWPVIDKEVKYARMPYVYLDKEERGKGHMKVVLEAFEYWAKTVGAVYCTVGTKIPKSGYKKVEVVYMKELK